jgi:hypothetical protein
MSRGPDWDAVERVAVANLRPGEPLQGLFPALTPRESSGGLAVVPLIPLIMVVEHLMWWRRTRQTAQTSMFPLAPRMIVGLTGQRMLIWAADRRWRLGDFLGSVDRDRIVQSTAPTVGAGWRTVRIYLANEPTVPIRVPAAMADHLAAALSGRQAKLKEGGAE